VIQLKCPDFHEFMTELVEAMRYKLVGRGFDYRLGHWDFILTDCFRLQQSLGSESASNNKENQQYPLVGKDGRNTHIFSTFALKSSAHIRSKLWHLRIGFEGDT
jgi:hypothetical protein